MSHLKLDFPYLTELTFKTPLCNLFTNWNVELLQLPNLVSLKVMEFPSKFSIDALWLRNFVFDSTEFKCEWSDNLTNYSHLKTISLGCHSETGLQILFKGTLLDRISSATRLAINFKFRSNSKQTKIFNVRRKPVNQNLIFIEFVGQGKGLFLDNLSFSKRYPNMQTFLWRLPSSKRKASQADVF